MCKLQGLGGRTLCVTSSQCTTTCLLMLFVWMVSAFNKEIPGYLVRCSGVPLADGREGCTGHLEQPVRCTSSSCLKLGFFFSGMKDVFNFPTGAFSISGTS